MMGQSAVEQRAFKIGLIVTIGVHLLLLLIVSSKSNKDDQPIIKRPPAVYARLMKKGRQDVAKKNRKLLPDKSDNSSKGKTWRKPPEKKTPKPKIEPKVVKKAVKKTVKKVEPPKPKPKPIEKPKPVKKVEKIPPPNLKNSLSHIRNKLKKQKKTRKPAPRKFSDISSRIKKRIDARSSNVADKKSKNGKQGTLGVANGSDEGTETDPTKTVQGSIYERRVGNYFKQHWKRPAVPGNQVKRLMVITQVYIGNTGNMIKFKILKNSSSAIFNSSVKMVLQKVKQVPTPPQQYQQYYADSGMEIRFVPGG